MMRNVDNVLVALGKLPERLLISYQYDAKQNSICFVVEYDKDAGADRAFIRIRFEDVAGFQRTLGAVAELQRFVGTYYARETRAATVVERINIEAQERGLIQVTFGFGHNFGSVSFACYGGVVADVRNMRAVRTGADEWDYSDADDGTSVDFYNPFDRQ